MLAYKESNFIFSFISVLFFIFCAKKSKKNNAVYLGIDLYLGFEKPKELVSSKIVSSLLMKRGFSPKMGYMYQVSKKSRLFFDIGYNYMTSSKYDTVINNTKKNYFLKSRGINCAVLIDYYIISKPTREFAINFGLSFNNLNEFIDINNEELNNRGNYSELGVKFGLSFMSKANFNSPIRFFYKRLGKNNLLGFEWLVPFLRV